MLFKAEIGAVSRRRLPGAGRLGGAGATAGGASARPGTAAVVEYARTAIAPVVSLYVNDFNAPARAAYRAGRFPRGRAYASVLF